MELLQCKLNGLRSAIDEIDRKITRLMLERMDIVDEVAPIKSVQNVGRSFFRVFREIEVILNAFSDLKNSYPKEFVIQIWRLFISASLNRENNFKICSSDVNCYWLAREYFGSFIGNKIIEDSNELIQLISEDKSGIVGCMPFPNIKYHKKWWANLPDDLKVFAIYPLSKCDIQERVLFIGSVDLEPTGFDETMLIIESDLINCSLLRDFGFSFLDEHHNLYLFLVDKFLTDKDLQKMKCSFGFKSVKIIGAFAKQF